MQITILKDASPTDDELRAIWLEHPHRLAELFLTDKDIMLLRMMLSDKWDIYQLQSKTGFNPEFLRAQLNHLTALRYVKLTVEEVKGHPRWIYSVISADAWKPAG